MQDFTTYIQNNSYEKIDENLSPILKRVGIIVISTVIPYLVSFGIRVLSIRLDKWMMSLMEKYPKHKDAIESIAAVIKIDLDKCSNCKDTIDNVEKQKGVKYRDMSVYEDEILNYVSSKDKQKVKDFFDLIKSDDFKNNIEGF